MSYPQQAQYPPPDRWHVPEIDGRIAVSVEFAFLHPEFVYWDYNAEAAGLGLDPWRLIDSDIEMLVNRPGYILLDRRVARGYIVYMQVPRP